MLWQATYVSSKLSISQILLKLSAKVLIFILLFVSLCPSLQYFKRIMAYMNKYQSDDYRRDELIRIIEHSVEKLTLQELEALYYDMTTKSYIND